MSHARRVKIRRWLITHTPTVLHPVLKTLRYRATVGGGRVLRKLPGTSRRLGPPRAIFASLPDYVAHRSGSLPGSASYRELYASHTVRRTLPRTVDPAVHAEFYREETREMRGAGVAVIDGGRVLTGTGTVIGPPDAFIFDVSETSENDDPEMHPIFLSMRLPPITKVDARVAVLTTHFSSQNYSHWMFDLIPRIHLLERSGIAYDKIVVPCDARYQKETLKLLGIDTNRIIADPDMHLQATQLIVPSLPGLIANPQRWACRYHRDRFLKHVRTDRPRRRILISRSKSGITRRVTNEDAVFAVLQAYGFERVLLEDLSFLDQVQLFFDAELIVSPHGAGLTNLLFCREDAGVIELLSPNYVNVIYWSLANQIGIDYGYLRGIGNSDLAERGRRVHEDITIDTAQMRRLVEEMLHGSPRRNAGSTIAPATTEYREKREPASGGARAKAPEASEEHAPLARLQQD